MSGYCTFSNKECPGWSNGCPSETATDTACRYHKCLWPSRQVRVEPDDKAKQNCNYTNEQLKKIMLTEQAGRRGKRRSEMKNMTDKETAQHLRMWIKANHGIFAWPTDACGYEQHIKFVEHRNKNWNGSTIKEFEQFILDYANTLDRRAGECKEG